MQQTEGTTNVDPAETHGLRENKAEINHVLAVMMKKRGMNWSEAGVRHKAQMNCLEATNNLYE